MKRLLIVLAAVVMVTSFALDAEAGLFRRKNKCCKPACCEPAPCCQPAPCCEPAPACGCEAAPACGCQAAAPAPCACQATACCESAPSCCQLSRREARRARRNGCCVQTCSYEASCGCEAASAPCGCQGATPIESAPAEGAAPEAAPEAPAPSA